MRAGAIALTLIIAVPIILGYAFATEDSTKDIESTENSGSLSDLVLNSTTPYYVNYTGANNNNMLLRTYYSQGDLLSTLADPDFVQTSSTTYSYTPIYETGTDHQTLPASSVETYTTLTAQTYGTGMTVDVELEDFDIASFKNISGQSPTYFVYTDDETIVVEISETVYAIRDGGGYIVAGHGYNGDFEVSTEGFAITADTELKMTYKTYYNFPESFPDIWNGTVNDNISIRLVTGGETLYLAYTDATSVSKTYETVTISHGGETDVYHSVSEIGFAEFSTLFTYYYKSSTIDTYADVSYGWNFPSSANIHYDAWLNGFINSYVRMMIHIESGETFIASESYSDGTPALTITSSNTGYVTAKIDNTTYNLGNYTDIMVEIDADEKNITVTGLSSWPSISTMPSSTYNTVTGTTAVITDDFTQLFISDVSTNSVEIRVDAAEIVAGYFPSTKNRVIDIYDIYPEDTHQSIVIDSIGVYGDYLTIGGVARPVTDGKITVGTTDVTILGMTIEYVEDNGTYTTYVNGLLVSESPTAPRLIFGGEWSLTLHRETTTTSTITQASWVAGEFAFDANQFVGAMLIVAVAAFVALGMTGGRSGAKVGILALICGGAVLTGLIII